MEGFGSSLVRVLLFLWTRTLEKGIIGFLSKQYLRFLTFRRRFYLLFASGKKLKILLLPYSNSEPNRNCNIRDWFYFLLSKF